MSKFQALIVGVMFGMCVVSTSAQAEFVAYGPATMVSGIVKDTVTGNLWARTAQVKKYADAQAFCAASTLGGLTWTLPSRDQLGTLPANISTTPTLDFSITPMWSNTAVPYTTNVWLRSQSAITYTQINTSLSYATAMARCIAYVPPPTVTVPTTGFYKFRMEQGYGLVTAKVNGQTVITVDTSFGGNEVVIGDLVAGEIVTMLVNGNGADSINKQALIEFPFVQWSHVYAAGAISLVMYDPLPEATLCEVTPEDLADAQSQLNLCKDTLAYTEGLLATANGQISLCNSDKAVVDGKLAESVAKVDELNQAVANANAQIASLQEQLAYALAQDCNNGHGNDPGKVDPSNPGKSEK